MVSSTCGRERSVGGTPQWELRLGYLQRVMPHCVKNFIACGHEKRSYLVEAALCK
jgi:hypothetical protein